MGRPEWLWKDTQLSEEKVRDRMCDPVFVFLTKTSAYMSVCMEIELEDMY
jgi:hypothetical protein